MDDRLSVKNKHEIIAVIQPSKLEVTPLADTCF